MDIGLASNPPFFTKLSKFNQSEREIEELLLIDVNIESSSVINLYNAHVHGIPCISGWGF